MEKEVFDQSIDEMLEFDPTLDVNSLLESTPALETDKQDLEDKEKNKLNPEDKDKNDDKISLKNINKVLEKNKEDLDVIKDEIDESEKNKDDDKVVPDLLDKKSQDTSDASFTLIFARDLVGQGLLSSFDETKFLEDLKNVGEATALRNLIKNEIDLNIETAKTDLDSGYQEYLRLVGQGVGTEEAGNLVELKNKFESIKVEDLTKDENVDLRKQVMKDYYKLTTSMTDSKIEKLVQNSIDLGDDIEESKEFHSILNKAIKEQIGQEEAEAKKRVELEKEENRRSQEALKENINSLDEIIPGVVINKQTKVQMYEAITKPVQDSKGRITNALWAKRTEDPMFFDERMAYLFATGYFEKGKTWTKASQAKITKEISELEKVLKSKNNTSSIVGSTVLRTPEQDKTIKDNIDSMRGIFSNK